MNRDKALNRFDFEDDGVFHQEVDAIAAIQLHAFICDGHLNLPLKRKSAPAELIAETFLISGFEQSWA